MVVVIIEMVGYSEGATITTIQTIMQLMNSLVRLFEAVYFEVKRNYGKHSRTNFNLEVRTGFYI